MLDTHHLNPFHAWITNTHTFSFYTSQRIEVVIPFFFFGNNFYFFHLFDRFYFSKNIYHQVLMIFSWWETYFSWLNFFFSLKKKCHSTLHPPAQYWAVPLILYTQFFFFFLKERTCPFPSMSRHPSCQNLTRGPNFFFFLHIIPKFSCSEKIK